MNLDVSNWSLTLAGLLVLVAMWIGYREKLGIDREIITAVIRAVIQLFVVGYLLKYVFRVNNVFLTLVMILIILFNASWNAQRMRKNGVMEWHMPYRSPLWLFLQVPA
ncbi:YbbM seven transmembrane helix protein [Pediococcus damnosus]|nr:YbbM seven transmembrane helix protein [Pediococcus damnosus]AMV64963.1 YbbM seven transmembrane helix protein [Pediococcus damnosus]